MESSEHHSADTPSSPLGTSSATAVYIKQEDEPHNSSFLARFGHKKHPAQGPNEWDDVITLSSDDEGDDGNDGAAVAPPKRPPTPTPTPTPPKPKPTPAPNPLSGGAGFLKERLRLAKSKSKLQKPNPFTGITAASTAAARDRIIALDNDNDDDENPDPDRDEEAVHQRALARFAEAKRRFEELKAADRVTFSEEIDFMRLEKKEKTRLRMRGEGVDGDEVPERTANGRGRGRGHAGSPGLFLTPDPPDTSLGKRLFGSPDDDLDGSGTYGPLSKRTRKAKKRKPNKRSMADVETTLRGALFGAPIDTPAAVPSTKSSNAPNRKAQPPKTTIVAEKMKTAKAPFHPELLDFGSTFTSNVFADTARNAHLPDQPSFQMDNKRKDAALKHLVASVPAEHKKTAQMERKHLLSATRDFWGRCAVRSDGQGGWVVRGMCTSLKNHQLLGSAFMRRRELGEDEPRGGICADGMGLGKTVTMLANMVNDMEVPKPPGVDRKITLVVVPAALVTQWAFEIQKHCKNLGKVFKYVSGQKPDTENPVGFLEGFDVVITTYHDVMTSYPKSTYPIELQTAREKQNWWENFYNSRKGELHRVKFHRVVLDEAQAIKNYKSRTSLACRSLQATHRWALSGTPVVNTPVELYPYFKFLRVPYTGSFKVFQQNYHGANEPDKVARLHAMLSRFMVRRTHQNTLFGAALIKLPKAEEKVFWVEFNDFERSVYEIVRRRMVLRINSMARSDKLERNYSNVLTMLLRLRQMCANLLLVEVVMRDILELEDHHKIRELAEAEYENNGVRNAQIVQVRRMLQTAAPDKTVDTQRLEARDDGEGSSSQGATARVDSPQQSINDPFQDGAPDPHTMDHGRQHGLQYDFQRYLSTLKQGREWEELKERTVCTSCRNAPQEPWVTSCYHLYCQECLETLQLEWANRSRSKARCMECNEEFGQAKSCAGFELDSVLTANANTNTGEDYGMDGTEADLPSAPTQAGFPGAAQWRKTRRTDDECAKTWVEMDGPVLPSAKTIAIKAQILNWLHKNPAVKIIIYTQFHAMIRILGKICQTEGWNYLQYHGKMTRGARDKALKTFEDPRFPILLASLKCGGLGLNLTMASKVICVDPWWNNAVEQQAFCRVFRIGQVNETEMTRFAVRRTVDEDMIKMQNRKQEEIDKIMEEGADGRRKALDIPDLMRLFGPVDQDENGRAFILVEDQDTLPRYNADSEDEGDED